MYLARQNIRGVLHYFIRESFLDPETGVFRYRNLAALGPNPGQYLVYPGGHAFYVDDTIHDQLEKAGCQSDTDDLDDLFWPFLRGDIRSALEQFSSSPYKTPKKIDPTEEAAKIEAQVQWFDKRRIHYLRYGAIDQGRIARLPAKLFRPLLDKSRDEKEQLFIAWEDVLSPREYRLYVYVIFHLAQFFSESSIARVMPQGLDPEEVEARFCEEFCRVAADVALWSGVNPDLVIPVHLSRYLVMFYDFDYGPASAFNDYINNFINSRRFYQAPPPAATLKPEEVSEIFDESQEALAGMDGDELTKLYRQKAHELHPDKGGSHEDFVRLSSAYRELMRRKGGKKR